MIPKPETVPSTLDEERLAHALVSRGLITREEAELCRPVQKGDAGPRQLLTRLVEAGFLTANQARRAEYELPLLLTTQIPGYKLLEKLGQGSMGTVFKAQQLSMDRLVAIKVLQPRLAANPDYLIRFHREARLAAKLSHNNIVQAIDVGSAGTIHFFIMEYVEGTTIQQELNRGKVYDEADAADIILQIACALRHAHRRQLIHRDIKPANIIFTKDRVAKLADLGMARETADQPLVQAEQGLTVGTPLYIAPEQIGGHEEIDGRADIYSLGATFYHMVTGRPPFSYPTVNQVLQAHLHEQLVPAEQRNKKLSTGLGEVIAAMMAKDRRQRYLAASDLILDLECLTNGQPPRLARQQISTSALEGLAEGEAEAEVENPDVGVLGTGLVPPLWVGIVAGLLGISVLLNVVLWLRR